MSVYIFPGQGSQKKGMGENLFSEFHELIETADQILGYSIEELCLEDHDNRLNHTQYAQPAIYVVNALKYYKYRKDTGIKPKFLAGHSLGEYNALLAAGAFDFETGLKLVKIRGEIMSAAQAGGMAAVIGLTAHELLKEIEKNKLKLEIANYNTDKQLVVSGLFEELEIAKSIFEKNPHVKAYIKLKTSGPFHSSYMEACSERFSEHVNKIEFSEIKIPVISNVTANVYKNSEIKTLLTTQIKHEVRWCESIQWLLEEGEEEFIEIGEGSILTKLVNTIKEDYQNVSFTFLEQLFKNCRKSPKKNVFGFYTEDKMTFINGEELIEKIQKLGGFLKQNVTQQERMVLLFPQGLEYIYAMFSCWYSNVTVVPLPITDGSRLQQEVEKVTSIIKDSKASFVFTVHSFEKYINELKELSRLNILYAEDILEEEEEQKEEDFHVRTNQNDLALILYTSGSTAAPKGVLLTHKIINEIVKIKQWGYQSDSRVVSWLPQFHAFGLHFGILSPAYQGVESILTTPELFISNPVIWFRLISKYHATHTGAPNFAFEYCSLYINGDETKDLSLESLESLLCAGEKIRYESYFKFYQKFKELNLHKDVLTPCYGMSEVALIVIKKKREAVRKLSLSCEALGKEQVKIEPLTGEILVSCGKSVDTTRIIIIDKQNKELCFKEQIGEICIHSTLLSLGYENQNTEFPKIVHEGEAFFCTGDLGFLYDDELFIVGRKKDIIIKNGLNYYPNDIEVGVNRAIQLEGLKSVVFAKEIHHTEEVILIQEMDERSNENQYLELVQKIRNQISAQFQIEIYEIVFVKKGEIPLTASKKIDRNKCRQQYLNKNMKLIGKYDKYNKCNKSREEEIRGQVRINSSIYDKLVNNILIPELKLMPEEVNQNLYLGSLGVDSIQSIRIARKIADTFQIKCKPGIFLRCKTVKEITGYIETEWKKENKSCDVKEQDNLTDEERTLSYGQKSIWMQCKLNPDCYAYHIPICLWIKGDMDCDSLQKAVDHTISRYPILRLKVEEKETGEYIQFVDISQFKIKKHDITGCYKEDVLRRVKETIEIPFSLEEGPLLRTDLFTSESETVILFTIHHIVFDGGSLMPFLNEVFDSYVSFLHNKPVKNTALSYNFMDFISIDKKCLTDKEGKRYWEKQLREEIPVTELPIQSAGHYKRRFVNHIFDMAVPAYISEEFRKLAEKLEVSCSTLFFSIYKILLYRYTNQRESIVGMPVMIRPDEGFDTAIGFFINVIPIRSVIQEGESFEAYVKKLHEIIFEGLSHASYPFYLQVKNRNQIKRSSHSNIFDIFFHYQNFLEKDAYRKFEEKYKEDFIIHYDREIVQKGEYNLTLDIIEEEEHLLRLKYNPDLYTRNSIALFAKHFVSMMQKVIECSELSIDDYDYLSIEERNRILVGFNQTEVDFQRKSTVYQLFLEQVLRHPEYKAVIYETEFLNYRELNEKVERLACYLKEKGVQPGQHVGISVSRSLYLPISLFAVMKLGAVYIPLDPKFPLKRLNYMVQDSDCNYIITEEAIFQQLNMNLEKVTIVLLDTEWETMKEKSENVAYLPASEDVEQLAYILYTSGSTGKPKGVMISQSALVNFLLSMQRKLDVKEKSRMLAITTYSFDIAGLELYLPFIAGAECYICSEEKTKNAELLKNEIRSIVPDFMQATPITWKMLFKVGWENEEKVKILCGGEALTKELKEYFDRFDSMVWNMYGPTETTIWSTMKLLKKNEPITIGTPIHNTQIYILDKNQKPVGEEIYGELCIAGDGISLGYYKKPDLTKEKFIENPFIKGKKLYKTGDIARWLPNGEIEFAGRMDQQVKINGYRIELEEIEKVLNTYEPIETSVVVVKGEEQKSLAAFYQCRQGINEIDYRDIRTFLEGRLPGYMIPGHFYSLKEIPLTPNGKIDKKVLSLRKAEKTDSHKTQPSKLSDITQTILNQVKELLSIEELSIEDGFFDIGGDSYTAIAFIDKVNEMFDCHLSVTTLFKYPSVKQFSDYISKKVLKNAAYEKEVFEVEQSDALLENGYPEYVKDSVAIIGIACEFPDACNHYEYWENLIQGKDSIWFTSKDMLSRCADSDRVGKKGFVPQYSTFQDKEMFDADFFQISPRDAQLMDPQMRRLLQNSWKAFEDAGYNVDKVSDVSVFMTAGNNYYQGLLPGFTDNLTKIRIMDQVDQYKAWILAQGGTIPTMISHKLGLEGTSLYINANCSSSLVALDIACKHILAGQSEYALVGAASIYPGETLGYLHQPGLNFSSSGYCRAFDDGADGMAGGEGAAVLLVKHALKAIEDKDPIYAFIRGTDTNNDGGNKVGFYAPSITGQSKVIRKVLERTKIDPETIDYVETHGTGTKIGDPIEVEALTEAFRDDTQKRQFCGIGSVKTNIGHLDTTAGLAGCIKAALSLYHGEIPASLHYEKPNAQIDFENSPFYVVSKNKKLDTQKEANRIAVSSFGIGGTNAHIILEKMNKKTRLTVSKEEKYIIPLSANHQESLIHYAEDLLRYIRKRESQGMELSDLAYTLQVGRKERKVRTAFVAASLRELKEQLESYIEEKRKNQTEKKNETLHKKQEKTADNYDQLAASWVEGNQVEWQDLYQKEKPKRISLPAYHFLEKKYWITEEDNTCPVKKEEECQKQVIELLGDMLGKSGYSIEKYHKESTQMEGLLYKVLLHYLRKGDSSEGSDFTYEELKETIQLQDKYEPWLKSTLDRLIEMEHLLRKEDGMYHIRNLGNPLKEWESSKRYYMQNPMFSGRVQLADEILEHVTAILSGEILATDVMFPNSSMDLVSGVYKDNLAADYFNEVIALLTENHVKQLIANGNKKIRIFEIGAGTGGTSQRVLAYLKDYEKNIEEYRYTDLSRGFLIHGQENYGKDRAFMKFSTYNVEKNSEEQKVELGSYDIILATNVLHATRNIKNSIRNAKQLLKENGKLFLNEINENSAYMHFTFGLLEGWWLYQDHKYRLIGGPAVGREAWENILISEGFAHISCFTESARLLGAQVITADYREVTKGRKQCVIEETIKETHMNHNSTDLPFIKEGDMEANVRTIVKEILGKVLKLEEEIIDTKAFREAGLDSLTGVSFIQEINEKLNISLETICIFDYPSVNDLVIHICETYKKELEKSVAMEGKEAADQGEKETGVITEKEPIAIIGMSGRFPNANNTEEFWESIIEGRDLTEKVTRWNLREYLKEEEKICEQGGFLKNIKSFDPLFFQVSGLEAAYMEPQQRILLEETWKALEDAGCVDLDNKRCGVFIGCTAGDYFNLLEPSYPAQAFWGNMSAIVPARIAYFLNLKGPAEAIDTACSSSLSAIHNACQSLWLKESEIALAGGIFIACTPRIYIAASHAGMLSKSGHCSTFDEKADGFIPAEGAGMLVLKPLSRAVKEGDHIYGVIKGSGMNQDGKTNGITAPSSKSQKALEKQVYEQFHINPKEIQLIETHGTGTKLGDPIEVKALKEAFKDYTEKESFCALGSVKTNIGHAQMASGVIGIIKILLSLQYEMIPPVIHYQKLNSNINLDHSPFYINTKAVEWKSVPYKTRNAAISSFGAGGTNVHMVIGEVLQRKEEKHKKKEYLFALSARTDKQLTTQVKRLKNYLEENRDLDCANVSYTLLTGRKHFEYRMMFTAERIEEAIKKLNDWLQKEKAEIPIQINESKAEELKNLYLDGKQVDFTDLFLEDNYRKLSLPTYPFEQEDYWYQEENKKPDCSNKVRETGIPIKREDSDFVSEFHGKEYFFQDHIVNKKSILPGSVYVEMASQALRIKDDLQLQKEQRGICMKEVFWIKSFAYDERNNKCAIQFAPKETMGYPFEITDPKNPDIKYCNGYADIMKEVQGKTINLEALIKSHNHIKFSKQAFYENYRKRNILYGEAFQAVSDIYTTDSSVLAKLVIPSENEEKEYMIHPVAMDAALQCLGVFVNQKNEENTPQLLFHVKNIEIRKACTKTMWVRVKYSNPCYRASKIDLELFNETGELCVTIEGVTTLKLEEESLEKTGQAAQLFLPVWDKAEFISNKKQLFAVSESLFITIDKIGEEKVIQTYPDSTIVSLKEVETIEEIMEQLERERGFQHIIWISKTKNLNSIMSEEVIASQKLGVIKLFNFIKALIRLNYINKKLKLTVITNEAEPSNSYEETNPSDASIFGLTGTIAKEFPNWEISMLDFEKDYDLHRMEQLPANKDGDVLLYRNHNWLTRKLYPAEIAATTDQVYKTGGVYVVIGGAGGIGQAYTRYMIENYKANMIWIGRTPRNKAIEEKCHMVSNYGIEPFYICADASDYTSLHNAYQFIKRKFEKIHGVLHAALEFGGAGLEKMKQETFEQVLNSKVNSSVQTARVFKTEPLDFMLFLSSINSYLKAMGQGNYAAACTFEDSFAKCLNREVSYPVKVINLGYCFNNEEKIEKSNKSMVDQTSFISQNELFHGIKVLLAQNTALQLALVKDISGYNTRGMKLESEQVKILPECNPSMINKLCAFSENENKQLLNEIRNKTVEISNLII